MCRLKTEASVRFWHKATEIKLKQLWHNRYCEDPEF